MARGAKRLAAFLGTEEPNNLHDEPAYEDKLRMISETIFPLLSSPQTGRKGRARRTQ
jgi:hypothetical protein